MFVGLLGHLFGLDLMHTREAFSKSGSYLLLLPHSYLDWKCVRAKDMEARQNIGLGFQ